jgi:hypothetical protein
MQSTESSIKRKEAQTKAATWLNPERKEARHKMAQFYRHKMPPVGKPKGVKQDQWWSGTAGGKMWTDCWWIWGSILGYRNVR